MVELHLLQDLQGLNVLSSWLALSTVTAEWRRKSFKTCTRAAAPEGQKNKAQHLSIKLLQSLQNEMLICFMNQTKAKYDTDKHFYAVYISIPQYKQQKMRVNQLQPNKYSRRNKLNKINP